MAKPVCVLVREKKATVRLRKQKDILESGIEPIPPASPHISERVNQRKKLWQILHSDSLSDISTCVSWVVLVKWGRDPRELSLQNSTWLILTAQRRFLSLMLYLSSKTFFSQEPTIKSYFYVQIAG